MTADGGNPCLELDTIILRREIAGNYLARGWSEERCTKASCFSVMRFLGRGEGRKLFWGNRLWTYIAALTLCRICKLCREALAGAGTTRRYGMANICGFFGATREDSPGSKSSQQQMLRNLANVSRCEFWLAGRMSPDCFGSCKRPRCQRAKT